MSNLCCFHNKVYNNFRCVTNLVLPYIVNGLQSSLLHGDSPRRYMCHIVFWLVGNLIWFWLLSIFVKD